MSGPLGLRLLFAVTGYVIDGQILVRPEANITRAEVATIFFRLMTKEFREANWATENDFTPPGGGVIGGTTGL